MVEAGFYHEFQSEIEDSEVEGIIKPQAHWNAKHKPVKLLGYELVEEKVLPAGTTTCTFSGLNGDEDEEYLIEFTGTVVTSSGDTIVSVKPNNDVGSNYLAIHHGAYRGNSHFSEDYSVLALGSTHYQVTSICKSKTFISAKSGVNRFFSSNIQRHNLGKLLDSICSGVWLNSVDNIISLVIASSSGSFNGNIRLWKKIPLNLED